ncbi:MAG: cobalt transporter CbiM [Spirochaetota bacterium]
MHIADGVLSAQVLAAGAAAAAGGTAVGLKKMDMERVPRVALMSAAFFVSSLIHVPAGPSSVHLVLVGLTGIMLGWASFPAMLVALFLQSLLFQFGGLTVLGVNTLNHAVPAVAVFLLLGGIVRRGGRPASAAAGAAGGALGVILAALMTAFSLVFSGEQFTAAARLIVAAHLPVAAVEGVISAFVVLLLRRVKPEVLEAPRAAPQGA